MKGVPHVILVCHVHIRHALIFSRILPFTVFTL